MIQLQPLATIANQRPEIGDDHWGEVESQVVLCEHMPEEALDGLESFSHVEIIYYFHRVSDEKIVSGARHPRNQTHWPKVGILGQRGKNRPNRLGLTIAQVIRREGRALIVKGLDAIDGTPVLDVKPVMREFLPREEVQQPDWATELMKQYW